MNGINEWISSIVCYLLFTTVVINLLPSGKYEKYLRLFAGCVLILLVLGPMAGGLKLEEKIDSVFRMVSFENEIGEFARDLEEMERKRLDRLMGQYEEETEVELIRMAKNDGLTVQSARVWLARDPNAADFGRIRGIELKVRETQNTEDGKQMPENRGAESESRGGISGSQDQRDAGSENSEDGAPDRERAMDREKTIDRDKAPDHDKITDQGREWEMAEISVEPVKSVTLGDGAGEKTEDISGTIQEQPADAPVRERENPLEIRRLRQEIAEYYQVEEKYVEIRLEN